MRFCGLSVSVVLCCQLVSALLPENSPEDATLFFEGLASKYGHPARKYDVITKDGYILTLHNLPGRSRVPVLLMHGFHATSDAWLLRGNISLAIVLANAGHDVWVANSRGNRYSRRHQHLDPDRDPAFWNYSFHEMGLYDLTATIDKVLEKTGAEKLNAIGHSQGTMLFFALGSTRPEYNAKINILIALGPVCFLNHIPPTFSAIIKLIPTWGKIMYEQNIYEAFNKPTRGIIRQLCTLPVVGYQLCFEGVIFTIVGRDSKEYSPEFAEVLFPHFPTSGSVKNILHLAQLHNRATFAQYDYGFLKNIAVYGASIPPEYDLSKVAMPVAIIVGDNDKLSTLKDVSTLRSKLPNVVDYVVSPYKQFNHLDDIWGAHMDVYLNPYIFKILEQYS
ncbi:lipase 1-like [Bicyclus anynana]|uniref:Lipase n=1 Tax=Bicyclus anynana TaxID=110368 RepID=A0A6J1NP40_BICAN|nr:lipase 1-like [Bicyclus anynana]